jgi:hypothetical protein
MREGGTQFFFSISGEQLLWPRRWFLGLRRAEAANAHIPTLTSRPSKILRRLLWTAPFWGRELGASL